MLRIRTWSLLATLLTTPTLALTLTHCSSNDEKTSAPDSVEAGKYQGLITGTTETGVLEVTIEKASSTQSVRTQATGGSGASVSGSISLVNGGKQITLTGSYDAVTGTLTLTGTTGSGKYSLTGKASGGSFAGTYTSPGNSGTFSLLPAISGAVTMYCGTYGGDSSGVWNLVVDGSGTALGSHCDSKSCGALTGKVTDDTVELQDPGDPAASATGTISGTTASGTYQGKSNKGTWQGSVDGCDVVAPTDGAGGAGGAGNEAGGAGGAGEMGGAGGEATGAGGEGGAGGSAGIAMPTLSPVVSGLTDNFAVSADDTYVYFFTSGEIHRCPVAGCTGDQGEKMIGPIGSSSLATSGSALFFTRDFHLIQTCAVSASPGCTPTTFTDIGASTYPAHLRVFGDNVYWMSEVGQARKIQTCPTAGCSDGYPKTILDSADAALFHNVPVSGLEVTNTNLYIASFLGGILRFDMSDAETVNAASGVEATPSAYGTGELAIVGDTMYWGELNDARVRSCALPACNVVTDYLTGVSSPAGVSSSAAGLFLTERGTPTSPNVWAAGSGTIRVVRAE
jgi:hypothetical protein